MDDLELVRAHLLQHGVMLTNRFLVTIPIPTALEKEIGNTQEKDGDLASFVKTGIRLVNILAGGTSTSKRGLQVMCSGTQIPGTNIEVSDNKMNGHDTSPASGASYDLLTTRFMSSADAYEKRLIDIWLNFITNKDTKKVEYFDRYVTDVMVESLDSMGESQYGATMYDTYPKLVTALELDKTQSNSFVTFEVQWKFSRLKYEVEENETNILGNTTAGKLVQDLQNGDVESAAARTRKVIVAAQNGTLDTKAGGEAYRAISNTVNNTAGVSAKDAENMIATARGSALKTVTSNNDKNALDNLVGKLK